MSETVFILGAGASKEVNAPLMTEFLDYADNLRKTQDLGDAKKEFDSVFDAISKLQMIHSKSEIDLINIESVFATFEMGKTLKRFFNFNVEEIDDLISSMKTLIVLTLERSIEFAIQSNQIKPHSSYNSFANLLFYLKNNHNPKHSVSVITFNYDVALDYAMSFNQIGIDYGLYDTTGQVKSKITSKVPLLKLHGSLNWSKCSSCLIKPWSLIEFTDSYHEKIVHGEWKINSSTLIPIGSTISEFNHGCTGKVERSPVIVPPTWNKTEYHRELSYVWSRAALELSEAENIFIIGYSNPVSDYFFHYLYALGSMGQNLLKRIWVFDPNIIEVGEKFNKLLGPGARDRFMQFGNTFSEAVPIIHRYFSQNINLQSFSEELIKSRNV